MTMEEQNTTSTCMADEVKQRSNKLQNILKPELNGTPEEN